MKKYLSVLAALLINNIQAQIIKDLSVSISTNQATSNFYHTKLGIAGKKYVVIDKTAKTIQVFNLNNSVFKTINIPTTLGSSEYHVSYLSDDLFDTNADLEYVLAVHPSAGSFAKVYIYDDTGAQQFFLDSAAIQPGNSGNIHLEWSGIFQSGTGLKMSVWRYSNATSPYPYRIDIFNLPGNLPCVGCSTTGTVTGIGQNGGGEYQEPVFYPNPASTELKLRYQLPEGTNTATIEIRDVAGKLVDKLEVTSHFDHVLIPESYNSGLYIYNLIVDGALVRSEKIVLSR